MPQTLLLAAVIALAALQAALGAPSGDLVQNLPGLTFSPNFKQYSGYLQGVSDRRLHYWLVESSSKPGKDPLVLWLSGPPGCSSLTEILTGNGPFMLKKDGVHLSSNPDAWNKEASFVYLEAPAGVGYSYSQSKKYTTTDVDTATNNYLALKDFLRKFPEYKDTELYIAGSGYGGVYVVSLVALAKSDATIKLKGFAIGNGFMSNRTNWNSLMYFLYHHDLIGANVWAECLDKCCPKEAHKPCNFYASDTKPECKKILNSVLITLHTSRINPFKLDAECAVDNSDDLIQKKANVDSYDDDEDAGLAVRAGHLKHDLLAHTEKANPSRRCLNDSHIIKYLNSSEVRKALHIPTEVQPWTVCSDKVQENYTRCYSTLRNQYEDALDDTLRILLYSGDLDITYNFLGSQWFVEKLNIKDAERRKFWYSHNKGGKKQIAGFVKVYQTLTLATVKGAGHFVSQDKPKQVSELFSSFIKNKTP